MVSELMEDVPESPRSIQSSAVLVSSNETVRQIPDQVGLQTCRSQRWLPTTSSHNWIKDERNG